MPPKRKNASISADDDASDWASLTVKDLKAELMQRALPLSGNKAALVARLDAADEAARPVAPPAVQLAAADEGPDWSSMTVKQLKAELSSRGLTVSGNKTTLINRLNDVADAPADAPAAAPAPKTKRARAKAKAAVQDESEDEEPGPAYSDPAAQSGERRLRAFVEAPDAEYKKKLKKVKTERLFMLDRKKGVDRSGTVNETFDIAGSTGNVYQVTIGRSPNCECMDARIRSQRCKHIKYALVIILKAPAHLCYQDAFLSTELESIFANAPVTRAPEVDHKHEDNEGMYAGKRKPIDGECPICVFDMEADEELVWCKAACGQNFHKQCFEQWKRSKHGARVTCVYCRTEWQDDVPNAPPSGPLAHLKSMAPKVGSYKNVANLMPEYQQEYKGSQA